MSHSRPTFIGIGAGKAGTSWLYAILSQHPEVCMASAKETLFFEDNYARGWQWYAKFFQQCGSQPAVGEVSNTYIFNAQMPARLHAFDPHLQLIATLRNPVDRAFSHYLFHYRNAQLEGSFEDAIAQYPDLIERGLYYRYLDAYLQYFQRDRLLLLLFDDLKADPVALARRVLTFLGVDPDWATPERVSQPRLPASKPRSKFLARTVKAAARSVRNWGFPEIVTSVKTSPAVRWLYRPYARQEYPQMAPEMRRQLNEYYRDDVRQLSQLVDRDLERLWLDR